jgi:hypothetical protein
MKPTGTSTQPNKSSPESASEAPKQTPDAPGTSGPVALAASLWVGGKEVLKKGEQVTREQFKEKALQAMREFGESSGLAKKMRDAAEKSFQASRAPSSK